LRFLARRFYLNRTASAIIWFSTLLLLTTGLAMDFAFLRGPWSTYPHHHALWAGILLVITLGMAYDFVMIPSMVSDKLYWERSRRARLRRKYAKGKKFETIAEDDEGEEADIDEDEVGSGSSLSLSIYLSLSLSLFPPPPPSLFPSHHPCDAGTRIFSSTLFANSSKQDREKEGGRERERERERERVGVRERKRERERERER